MLVLTVLTRQECEVYLITSVLERSGTSRWTLIFVSVVACTVKSIGLAGRKQGALTHIHPRVRSRTCIHFRTTLGYGVTGSSAIIRIR